RGRGGPAGRSHGPIDGAMHGAIEGKGNQVELAGIITGTIKLLIGIGVIIGLVIALLLVRLFGGSRSKS
ncbi:MAG TPA: hypothetical protein VG779_06040, partial [Actinomycetota bacterium]|nr:hypothetical protein [Actinomycetota bacterium]